MFKKLNKVFSVFLSLIMMVSIVYTNVITTKAETTDNLNYNIASSQVPFIYCYKNGGGTVSLTNGNKTLPDNIYRVIVYIKAGTVDVQESQSKVFVNNQEAYISWGSESDGYYKTMSFSVNSTGMNKVDIQLDYSYKKNFSIRTRKILTGSGDQNKMEAELNAHPATYLLYDQNQNAILKGESNTAISSYTNFVHWTQLDGGSQYIGKDDTYIANLPNGEYTIVETDAGGSLKTRNQTSSSVWLNASFMKESDQGKYYTFSVNDNLVNEWMDACINDNQSNSLFFGFYSESEQKYSVSYDGNGNDQGMMSNHLDQVVGDVITLNNNQFEKWGYVFTGWNTVANPTQTNPGVAYADGAEFTIKAENTILYAQWKIDLNTTHTVYVRDNTQENPTLNEVDHKNVPYPSLAYNEEELQAFAGAYIIEGYQYGGYEIEFKPVQSNQWLPYDASTILSNNDQVRYILNIDKDETKTKTLAYHVEYWLEGEETAHDLMTVSKEVWLHDTTSTISLNPIEMKTYAGYQFSHYEPTNLPQVVENNTTIKVVYTKKNTPVVPEEPTIPEVPVTPEIPVTPETPVTPEVPVIPETPVTPVVPVIPETPAVPVQPIVVNPITINTVNTVETEVTAPTQNTIIEENQVPQANGVAEEITENTVPLAAPQTPTSRQWALVNLICAIVTVLFAMLSLILKKEKETKDDDEEKQKAECAETAETVIYQRRSWMKALSVVVALVAVIIFVLTEDITLPMVMMDKWTLLMAIVLLVGGIVYIGARQWHEVSTENQD